MKFFDRALTFLTTNKKKKEYTVLDVGHCNRWVKTELNYNDSEPIIN